MQTMEKYERKIFEQQERDKLIYEENETAKNLISSLKKIFTDDQIHRLKNPKSRSHWSNKTMQQSIAMKTICGPTAYEYLYSRGYPIPHINTIYNHMRKIECEPGILYDFIDMTELKVATMPARDKYVILTLDEMSIKPNYTFNNHTQSFMGNPTIPCSQGVISKRMKEDPTWDQDEALATHAFFAMIASLCARFKCLVGVEFTDNGWCPKAVAKWMRQIIQKIYDIGLITKAIVMDMSGSNQTI